MSVSGRGAKVWRDVTLHNPQLLPCTLHRLLHSNRRRPAQTRTSTVAKSASRAPSSTSGPGFSGQEYYATCHPGLEEVVARELGSRNIQAHHIETSKAGVYFRGRDLAVGYRANLWLRSGIRVLRLLSRGYLDPWQPGGDEIYSLFRQAANWPELLPPGYTFSIQARVASCTDVPSSMLVQIRGRDAICDSIRDARGTKPFPPEKGQVADVPLYAALFKDEFTLYLDMSGESLHKRGYRTAMHASSLNESAAAGLLSLADWPATASSGVLADPMCGSGTFLIEAALMAANTAPGLFRQRWPFQSWPDFDQAAWADSVDTAQQAHQNWNGLLLGNDVHSGALGLAQRDAAAAGVAHLIKWQTGACSQWRPPTTPSNIIVNPPWGLRLLADEEADERTASGSFAQGRGGPQRVTRQQAGGYQQPEHKPFEGTALQTAWVDLRTFLKEQCPKATAHVLSGNPDITREMHMRAERKYPVTIGNIDCRFLKYKILPPKGSAKARL